jgi:phosphoglycolate phosphatase
VLFDLDGTLADTAPDMASALNVLLREEGRGALEFPVVRNHVSRGAAALIRLAFGSDLPEDEFERLRKRFLDIYAAALCVETQLFPEMSEVLRYLEESGLSWGVVTNKPAWLTDKLMEALGLTARAACIVSGDTTDQRKPHPKPLLHACTCCGRSPGTCVYIGDDPRDIQAGEAAGMVTLVALYGYISDREDPYAWGADDVIASPSDLPSWLDTSTPAAEATG